MSMIVIAVKFMKVLTKAFQFITTVTVFPYDNQT